MARVLEARYPNNQVIATDLHEHGYGTAGFDFTKATGAIANVVTNPALQQSRAVFACGTASRHAQDLLFVALVFFGRRGAVLGSFGQSIRHRAFGFFLSASRPIPKMRSNADAARSRLRGLCGIARQKTSNLRWAGFLPARKPNQRRTKCKPQQTHRSPDGFEEAAAGLEKTVSITSTNLVDMQEPLAKGLRKNKGKECGTPACHGGWLAFAHHKGNFPSLKKRKQLGGYKDGASALATLCGFDGDVRHLWKFLNPKIWGNCYYIYMFDIDGEEAFGRKMGVPNFTIHDIIASLPQSRCEIAADRGTRKMKKAKDIVVAVALGIFYAVAQRIKEHCARRVWANAEMRRILVEEKKRSETYFRIFQTGWWAKYYTAHFCKALVQISFNAFYFFLWNCAFCFGIVD